MIHIRQKASEIDKPSRQAASYANHCSTWALMSKCYKHINSELERYWELGRREITDEQWNSIVDGAEQLYLTTVEKNRMRSINTLRRKIGLLTEKLDALTKKGSLFLTEERGDLTNAELRLESMTANDSLPDLTFFEDLRVPVDGAKSQLHLTKKEKS